MPMTLRTPRRRISPRARRRYRVIRDFFRRTLGTKSEQDIKINSSIAVDVSGLKRKMVGIEQNLSSRREYDSMRDAACDMRPSEEEEQPREEPPAPPTTVLYGPSNTRAFHSEESDYVDYREMEPHAAHSTALDIEVENNVSNSKLKKKKSKNKERVEIVADDWEGKLDKRALSALETAKMTFSPKTRRSLESAALERAAMDRLPRPDGRHSSHLRRTLERRHERRPEHRHRREQTAAPTARPPTVLNKFYEGQKHVSNTDRYYPQTFANTQKTYRDANEGKNRKVRKEKLENVIDQDFIENIIQKQYKPVKMFGRKQSDISQYSEPVCRDRESTVRDVLMEGSELCSCCARPSRPSRPPLPSRSCRAPSPPPCCHCEPCCCPPARHCASHRCARSRLSRYHTDDYNDAAIYDIIPVKEKTSPKSRRKYLKDEMISYSSHKEVPASPRTHRPRLNLQVRADYEEFQASKVKDRLYPGKPHKRNEYLESYSEGDDTSVSFRYRKEHTKLLRPNLHTSVPIQEGLNDESLLTSYDTKVNHTQSAPDKTDKTLCEIKDILQNFLQEIKKELSSTEIGKATNNNDTTEKSTQNVATQPIPPMPPVVAGPGARLPTYTVAHCSLPSGYMQSSFCNHMPMLPVCSHACGSPSTAPLAPSPNEPSLQTCVCHPSLHHDPYQNPVIKDSTQDLKKNNETEELIKQIHKMVTLHPKSVRRKSPKRKPSEKKVLTSRSVGSSQLHRDADAATSALRCYSKSCEAIGARLVVDTSYSATQSDTVIGMEKLNLDVSRSETEVTERIHHHQPKRNTFVRALQSMRLLKKKKSEFTEGDSSLGSYPSRPGQVPLKQQLMDYEVRGARPTNPPPPRPRADHYPYERNPYHHPYYSPHGRPPRAPSPQPAYSSHHHQVHQPIPEYEPEYDPRRPSHHAPPPHYDPYYGRPYEQPQVPLCLKEIEVRSTGTQSERKLSFLHRFAKRPVVSSSSENPETRQYMNQPQRNAYRQPAAQYQQQAPRYQQQPAPYQQQAAPYQQQAAPYQQQGPPYQQQPQRPQFNNPIANGWRKFQEKVLKDINEDPVTYGFKTRQKLMGGNGDIRKSVLKKMFYKKNPFSPNNLIIRTLLGNDPSSFGNPDLKYKQRLLF